MASCTRCLPPAHVGFRLGPGCVCKLSAKAVSEVLLSILKDPDIWSPVELSALHRAARAGML